MAGKLRVAQGWVLVYLISLRALPKAICGGVSKGEYTENRQNKHFTMVQILYQKMFL